MHRRFPLLQILGIFLFLTGIASAQELPPPDGTPPGEPPVETLDPPGGTPPSPATLISPPIFDGNFLFTAFYYPDAGTAGTWEYSVDLVNWITVEGPEQVSSTHSYSWEVAPGQSLYVRWVAVP